MSDVKKIKIEEICEYANKDSSLKKEVIEKKKGIYPVYSASVGTPIGFIDSYYNTNSSIIIPTAGNGSAGKPYLVKDNFYSISNNAIGLIPKDNINIDYLYYELLKNISKKIKGESFKNINKTIINSIEIEIPIKADGTFDLEAQKELAKKYQDIENIKTNLCKKIDELVNIKFNL